MVVLLALMDNFFIIESPASTWMFDFPPMLAAFRLLKTCGIKLWCFQDAVKHDVLEPFVFVSICINVSFHSP